jgi:DNA-binding NarL/FixJ family response regulator
VRPMAQDPISLAGLTTILERHPGIRPVLERGQSVQVVVFAAETLTSPVVAQLRSIARDDIPVVLLTTGIQDASLVTLIECGVVGFLDRRSMAEAELADAVIAAAAGEGTMSGHDLSRLLRMVKRMQAEVAGSTEVGITGLSARETDVLRLISEGRDTAEVARKLSYSESTVKHILMDVTTRLELRNRCHAVAFAIRAGLI